MLAYLLYSIVGIIALLVLIALFIKKEYTLVSEVVINKSKEEVFNYVIHLKNQLHYNKWIMNDPHVKLAYTGTDGSVGFISAWEGKNSGKGEQEIKTIVNGEECTVELRFEKPFKGISYSKVVTTAVSSTQTKVTTTFDTHTPFPMSIMIPLLKNMLQKDMNTNAQNLKRAIEAN